MLFFLVLLHGPRVPVLNEAIVEAGLLVLLPVLTSNSSLYPEVMQSEKTQLLWALSPKRSVLSDSPWRRHCMIFCFLLLPQKTLLPCLRMGEVRPEAPGTASKETNVNRDPRESRGGCGGGRGRNATCAHNPLPWTSKTRSKLRGGGQGF